MPRVLAVVPARLGSERLARKPLQMLAGRPLVQHVWDKAKKFTILDRVVIATDAAEIENACKAFGGDVVITSPDHKSGTERVAEVAARADFSGYDIIVNIQGDEPFIEATHIAESVRMVIEGFDIGTVAAPIQALAAWYDPAAVKVARAANGRALYFSRAPIPHRRGAEPTSEELNGPECLRHIGVYAFTRRALAECVALPASRLEHLEKLEQLRALEAGMSIGVAIVGQGAVGIDTPADLQMAEERVRGLENNTTESHT